MNRFIEICYSKSYNLIVGRSLEMYKEQFLSMHMSLLSTLILTPDTKNIDIKIGNTVKYTNVYMLRQKINAVLGF